MNAQVSRTIIGCVPRLAERRLNISDAGSPAQILQHAAGLDAGLGRGHDPRDGGAMLGDDNFFTDADAFEPGRQILPEI
jgi:hypothetical protein